MIVIILIIIMEMMGYIGKIGINIATVHREIAG